MSAPVTEDDVLRLWERYESAKRMAECVAKLEPTQGVAFRAAEDIHVRAFHAWIDAFVMHTDKVKP